MIGVAPFSGILLPVTDLVEAVGVPSRVSRKGGEVPPWKSRKIVGNQKVVKNHLQNMGELLLRYRLA
jgi:hypothetical protein